MTRYMLKKWANRRMNLREFRRREIRLRSLPPIAYVEPTNLCMLRCALCPSGQHRFDTVGKMDMRLYRRVLDELGPALRELHLYNWGEPLLHPDLAEMVAYARQYGPEVWVSTNLNRLDRVQAEDLVRSGLDHLNVSIDGATQESYETYRVGGNLDAVLENLVTVREAKATLNSPLPRVRWQFLVTRQNEGEIEQARALAARYGAEFKIKRMRVNLDTFTEEPVEASIAKNESWLPTDPKYSRHTHRQLRPRTVCKHLWDRTIISWNGAVAPCCQIFEARHYFTHELSVPFRDVWNGPHYVAARALFAESPPDDVPEVDLVCKQCKEMGNIL